ncbi:hypothetical protein Lal_00039436 [Lupinus albus]|nr:hypothetical protein Lal_00039436 [Lupinus albus]
MAQTPTPPGQIVVTLGISRCRIAEEIECIFIVFRFRDKEITEVLGWGYAERKVFFVEIVVTLGISRCRIAEEIECIFIVFRFRDKERTEVLGWGYAERKVFFVVHRFDQVDSIRVHVPAIFQTKQPRTFSKDFSLRKYPLPLVAMFLINEDEEDRRMMAPQTSVPHFDGDPPRPINLDDLMGLDGPITRARGKKAQGTLGQLILSTLASIGPSEDMRPTNCLLIKDEPFEGHD